MHFCASFHRKLLIRSWKIFSGKICENPTHDVRNEKVLPIVKGAVRSYSMGVSITDIFQVGCCIVHSSKRIYSIVLLGPLGCLISPVV